jgi:mannobiose 2-epimerase
MVELALFKKQMEEELVSILGYWMQYAKDELYGGFIGKIDHFNRPALHADKGSVLNSRILWTFSAAFSATKNPLYRSFAQRAYNYFTSHFIDKEYGGVYWSVDYQGNKADTKKQVYAQSFAVYALSEYHRATEDIIARQMAIDLYNSIELFSFDEQQGGYIDAFAQDWSVLADLRLSAKDQNATKTMNTHLHLLEAYSNLYREWPNDGLKLKINNLLRYFNDYIIDADTAHLVLFFDESWHPASTLVSYGHDIEAAWLLQEAAETIHDEQWIAITKNLTVKIAEAARQGLDADGGLWYEYQPANNELVKEKHWWPQAEAIVGFFHAWQVSGRHDYLQLAWNSWTFTKKNIRDKKNGEWIWGVRKGNEPMLELDKAGVWKCPYHNGRACMEIMKRIV